MRTPAMLRHRRTRADSMMAPLIDVVFLLLVFFLVSASMQVVEGVFSTNVLKTSEAPAKPRALERLTITLRGDRKRREILLNNTPYPDFRELGIQLRLLRQHADLPVIINPDRQTPFQDVVTVMDICRDVSLTKVTLATSEDPRSRFLAILNRLGIPP